MTTLPHIAILGGGPAGVGAAYQLRRTGKARVTLIEAQQMLGGNAGSFRAFDQYLDYGSHRLHHAVDPQILADIKRLLGSDLKDMPRHGRIRLRGKWLHFPLKPLDLLLRLDKRFAAGIVRDMIAKRLRRRDEGDSFASVLRANLGATICDDFYFPYARKIWGHEPAQLSAIAARKRVSAGSFAKMIKRLLRPPGAGFFYYPRRGYGQITDAYAAAAKEQGADIRLATRALALSRDSGESRWRLEVRGPAGAATIEADQLWSTIPVTVLARMMQPATDATVLAAADKITYRAMVLVYLQLPMSQFTTTDAHYFPEAHIAMTRLSEPKNYWASIEPRNSTTLCAELPCMHDDELWSLSDEELGARVAEDIERAGLPLPVKPTAVLVKRLPQAYPIYLNGYEQPLAALDRWCESLPGVLTYGRQGLFAHDNLHHALYMAYAAVDCLAGTAFDHGKWRDYREIFATHVVED